APLLRRDGGRAHPLVHLLELSLAVHEHAAVDAAGHDESAGELVEELRGEDEAPLVVELRREGAQQQAGHPPTPPARRQVASTLPLCPPQSTSFRRMSTPVRPEAPPSRPPTSIRPRTPHPAGFAPRRVRPTP